MLYILLQLPAKRQIPKALNHTPPHPVTIFYTKNKIQNNVFKHFKSRPYNFILKTPQQVGSIFFNI